MPEFPFVPVPPSGAPPAFHLLAKPSGSACNLDCAYCFFLDKELLYPGSKFRMSDAMLEQYIRQLIESHQENFVNIAWQGGEPTLMGLDFYRQALRLADKYRRPGMRFLHTMQTNGTLIDDEWATFFKEHNFLIGISLDGPRQGLIYFSDDGDLVGLRYDNWKFVFAEQRVQGTVQIWAEPFVFLRVPKIFNLRTDPFERADITSNTYYDWLIDRVYLTYAAQFIVREFLNTFLEFPPRMKPASFTVDDIMKKMEQSFDY